jgi:hypothetical protein
MVLRKNNMRIERHPKNMATGDQQSMFEAVWDTVRNWPTPERRSLASRLLASLGSDDASPSTRSASDLIGAWRDAAPLDDAAVEALLEEELLRKHA